MKLFFLLCCALALLTGCPDAKPPKDPAGLPMPKTAPTAMPAISGIAVMQTQVS